MSEAVITSDNNIGVSIQLAHVQEDNTTTPITPFKKCYHCKAILPLSDFHHNRSSKDGRSNTCKACMSIFMHQYTERNRKTPLDAVVCKRCGYEWVPRNPQPVKCASCQSPYWNKTPAQRWLDKYKS